MSKVSSGEFDGDRRYTCVMCVLLYELYSLIEIITFPVHFLLHERMKVLSPSFYMYAYLRNTIHFSNNASNHIILVKSNTSHTKFFMFFFTKLFGNIDNTYVIVHFSSFFFHILNDLTHLVFFKKKKRNRLFDNAANKSNDILNMKPIK